MTGDQRETEIHAIIKAKVNQFHDMRDVTFLTSREDWSDISNAAAEKIVTPELIEKLEFSGQQEGWICNKGDKVGVWLELEYVTCHSDDEEDIIKDVYDDKEVPTSPQQIVQCAFDAISLQNKHPEAEFFVIEGNATWSKRVCLCAFVPETATNKNKILNDFYSVQGTKVDPGIVKQVFGDELDTLTTYFKERKDAFLANYKPPINCSGL